MNASKEECRKAQAALDKLTRLDANIAAYEQISTFLQAAERKLPNEASYAKEKKDTSSARPPRGDLPMPKSKHKEGPSGWGETKETGL